jgi:hypothetical protein
MPILDYDNEFTTAGGQAVTADAIGTRVLDAGAAKDWGAGEPVIPYVRITSDAVANPTTGETVDIVGADNAALTSNAVVLSTGYFLAGVLTANSLHHLPPLKPGSNKRYLGCRFVNTGGAPSTGKWKVGLLPGQSGRPQDGVNSL